MPLPPPGSPSVAARFVVVAATVAASAVILAVGGSASNADERRVLAVEHSDVLHITYSDGDLGLAARIGNAPDVEFADPAELIYQVVDSVDTRLTVPDDPRYSFLGSPGAATWVAPQVQNPRVVWPGWDTEEIPAGVVDRDIVTIALTDVTGPGTVEVFQTSSTGPDRVFSSSDPAMTLDQTVGAHVHANWAFSALGSYTLTFEVTARPTGSATPVTSGPTSYSFVVGDLPPETTTTTSGPGSTTSSSTTASSTTTPASTTSVAPSTTTTAPPSTTAPSDGDCGGLDAVLDSGHIDIAARTDDGTLRTQLKDTTAGPTPVIWRDLETVGLHVTDDARTEIPASAEYAFLGPAGEEVWLLPQTQEAGILWPGWNTEAVDYDQLAGPVTWSLDEVTGPGRLAVYELGALGEVRVVFDSDEPLPQTLALPSPTHAHGNWVFTEAGVYHLTFSHDATSRSGASPSSEGTIAVAVGDVDLAELCPGGTVPSPGGGGEVTDDGDDTSPSTGGSADGASAAAAGASESVQECTPVSVPATSAASTTTAPVDPVVLDAGHVDYAARLEEGVLRSRVKDGTVAGRTEWRDPASTVLHLTSAGATEIPDAGFEFLGAAGTPIWQIPQTQQAGLLWLGWNTEELSSADVDGSVTWTLDAIDGPGDLAVFAYDAFGSPEVIFNSRDGVGDSHQIALGTHAHGNWAFTAQGAYRVTFTHTATLASGAAVSDTQTALIAVGDTDPGALARSSPADQQTSASVVVTGADGCPRIARTGTGLAGPIRLATVLLLTGALAVTASRRRPT